MDVHSNRALCNTETTGSGFEVVRRQAKYIGPALKFETLKFHINPLGFSLAESSKAHHRAVDNK